MKKGTLISFTDKPYINQHKSIQEVASITSAENWGQFSSKSKGSRN